MRIRNVLRTTSCLSFSATTRLAGETEAPFVTLFSPRLVCGIVVWATLTMFQRSTVEL